MKALYLIPTPLGENSTFFLSPDQINEILAIRVFIVEKVRTARRFLAKYVKGIVIDNLTFYELNTHTSVIEKDEIFKLLLLDETIGLMSEAGVPAVADPGALVVEEAHKRDLQVVPMIGPSSILMALMASGLNGQSFAFNGYLSPKKDILQKELARYESFSQKNNQTQIFIETPYRNNQFLEVALRTLNGKTKFTIAVDISMPSAYIATKTVGEWKRIKTPNLHKRPCIFLYLG